MNKQDFFKKLAKLPTAEADELDVQLLAQINPKEQGGVELSTFKTALECSGKILVRIPKSLHSNLAIQAQADGVSLNQYILYKLSK